jgi:hypothetical protein
LCLGLTFPDISTTLDQWRSALKENTSDMMKKWKWGELVGADTEP